MFFARIARGAPPLVATWQRQVVVGSIDTRTAQSASYFVGRPTRAQVASTLVATGRGNVTMGPIITGAVWGELHFIRSSTGARVAPTLVATWLLGTCVVHGGICCT